MIELKGIMGIPFLKKSRFTGSDGELRYLLEKRSAESVPEGALWPAEDGADAAAEDRKADAENGADVRKAAAAAENGADVQKAATAVEDRKAMGASAESRKASAERKAMGAAAEGWKAAGPRQGDCLAAVFWRGPYCSDATPDEEKTTAYFTFDREGLAQAQDWLNSR